MVAIDQDIFLTEENQTARLRLTDEIQSSRLKSRLDSWSRTGLKLLDRTASSKINSILYLNVELT